MECVPYFELKRPFLMLQQRMPHLLFCVAELYLVHALYREFLAGRH